MEHNQKIWFDFTRQASLRMKKGQNTDTYLPHIYFSFEPHFHNYFFLQLQWKDDGNTCEWFRTTWYKKTDAVKFINPVESLKYIGKEIQPTINYENGIIERKEIIHLIEFAKTLRLQPRVEKWECVFIDGAEKTLRIGRQGLETTYEWNVAPDEWSDLEKIADMMIKLNEKLT